MRVLLALTVLALAAPLALAAQAPGPAAEVVALNVVLMDVAGFAAPVMTVNVGGTVTFTSIDFTLQHHTATALDGSFDTGHVVPQQSVTVKVGTAGTHIYHCQIHPWMYGVVVAQ